MPSCTLGPIKNEHMLFRNPQNQTEPPNTGHMGQRLVKPVSFLQIQKTAGTTIAQLARTQYRSSLITRGGLVDKRSAGQFFVRRIHFTSN